MKNTEEHYFNPKHYTIRQIDKNIAKKLIIQNLFHAHPPRHLRNTALPLAPVGARRIGPAQWRRGYRDLVES